MCIACVYKLGSLLVAVGNHFLHILYPPLPLLILGEQAMKSCSTRNCFRTTSKLYQCCNCTCQGRRYVSTWTGHLSPQWVLWTKAESGWRRLPKMQVALWRITIKYSIPSYLAVAVTQLLGPFLIITFACAYYLTVLCRCKVFLAYPLPTHPIRHKAS